MIKHHAEGHFLRTLSYVIHTNMHTIDRLLYTANRVSVNKYIWCNSFPVAGFIASGWLIYM